MIGLTQRLRRALRERPSWTSRILAALIVGLCLALPITLPAGVYIGALSEILEDGASGPWLVLEEDAAGLASIPRPDSVFALIEEPGGVRLRRFEVPEGITRWLATRHWSIDVEGISEVTLIIRGRLAVGSPDAVRVGLSAHYGGHATVIYQSVAPIDLSAGADAAPVTVAEVMVRVPDLWLKLPAGPAIGVTGPAVLLLERVEVSTPGWSRNTASRPASLIWGVDTRAPWIALSGSLLPGSPRGSVADYSRDPAAAQVIALSWLLLVGLMMVILTRGDQRLATVVLTACLAVGAVEPGPFEVLVIAWVAGGLTRDRSALRPLRPARARWLVLTAILGVASVLSYYGGGLGPRSLIFLGKTLYLLAVGTAFTAYVLDREDLRAVFSGLAAAAVLGVVGGGISYLLPASLPGSAQAAGLAPFAGLMKDKNILGTFQVMGMIAIWTLRPRLGPAVSRARRALTVGVSGLTVASIIASVSRAAWLSLAGVLGLLILIARGSRLRVLLAVAGLAIASVTLTCLVPGLLEQVTEKLGLQPYDLTDRFPAQLAALRTGLANPLGAGPSYSEITHGFSTHNVYLRLLAENGWLALISFTALMLGPCRVLWRRRADPYAAGLLASLAVIGVNGLVIDVLHWRFLWVILGAAWAYLALPESGQPAGDGRVARE